MTSMIRSAVAPVLSGNKMAAAAEWLFQGHDVVYLHRLRLRSLKLSNIKFNMEYIKYVAARGYEFYI